MKIPENINKRIQVLIHRMRAYTEIIYTDAIILGYAEFAKYFSDIVTETSEIRRIVLETLPEDDSKEKDLFKAVVREELARRMYIVQYLLKAVPSKWPESRYEDFELGLRAISECVQEVTEYFNRILDIPSEKMSVIPMSDLQSASDFSLAAYLAGMPDRVQNTEAGTIIFAGEYGVASGCIRPELMKAGFHTMLVNPGDSILDAIELYDVCLVCYDCGAYPQMGEQVLKSLSENSISIDIPVLMCGADYADQLAVRFIQCGAIDYYAPGCNIRLLFSRIIAAVKTRKLNYRRQLYIRALEMSKYSTAREFTTAAAYVSGLLPEPFKNDKIGTDWYFLPSLELGGDIFDYFWLSDTKFAVYLLDVSGHGLEASLYSVTVKTLLEKKQLQNADFFNPSSVLTALNTVFDIETQNNMFFTIWYGVYDTETRNLTYSSAGLQPAILFIPEKKPWKLSTGGVVIGVDDDSEYCNASCVLPHDSSLVIFSDGIYEIRLNDNSMMTEKKFIRILADRNGNEKKINCRSLARHMEEQSKTGQFDDDVSLLEINFF